MHLFFRLSAFGNHQGMIGKAMFLQTLSQLFELARDFHQYQTVGYCQHFFQFFRTDGGRHHAEHIVAFDDWHAVMAGNRAERRHARHGFNRMAAALQQFKHINVGAVKHRVAQGKKHDILPGIQPLLDNPPIFLPGVAQRFRMVHHRKNQFKHFCFAAHMWAGNRQGNAVVAFFGARRNHHIGFMQRSYRLQCQ